MYKYRLAVVPVDERTVEPTLKAREEIIDATPHEYGFTIRNINAPKHIHDAFAAGVDNVLDTHYNVPKQSFPRHITSPEFDYGERQIGNRYPRIELMKKDTLGDYDTTYGQEISMDKNTGEGYVNRENNRVQPLIRYTVDSSEKDPYTLGKKAAHKAIAYHFVRNNLHNFPEVVFPEYIPGMDNKTVGDLYKNEVDKYSKHLSKEDKESLLNRDEVFNKRDYLERIANLYSTLYANHAINYDSAHPNPADFHKWMKSQILRDHSAYHPTSDLGTILHLTNNLIRSGKF